LSETNSSIELVRSSVSLGPPLTYFAAEEEFEDLCFEFGLELEYGTGAEMQMARIDGEG